MVSRRAIRSKKRYQEDREFRERTRARNRSYRAAHKDEINARRRERYRTDREFQERLRGYRHSRLYGISRADYDALLVLQGGVCAICKKKPGRRRLAVDHCHICRKLRGLLCSKCNVGLGQYDDDTGLMLAAIAYLEASRRDIVKSSASRATAAKIAKSLRRRLELALRAQFALRRGLKRTAGTTRPTSRSSGSGSPPPGSSRRPARRR